jgi:hypothetical protein
LATTCNKNEKQHHAKNTEIDLMDEDGMEDLRKDYRRGETVKA